jgi:hypothetical protein
MNLDFPGPWPKGHSWATFRCCSTIRKERRRGRTNRLGWRFVAYVLRDHKMLIGDAIERRIEGGDTEDLGLEELGAFFTRHEAQHAASERLHELAADPANWYTGASSRHQEQKRCSARLDGTHSHEWATED